jgi:hypothetical protein
VSCGGDGDGVALEHRGEERGEVMVSIRKKGRALADLTVKGSKNGDGGFDFGGGDVPPITGFRQEVRGLGGSRAGAI